MRSRYLKHLKPKLYEKKGRLPPRARKQQTEYESSSDEDTGPWNEFLSSDEVNPVKTRRRLKFISDNDTE